MSQEETKDKYITVGDLKKALTEEHENKTFDLLNRLDGKMDKIILIMLATLGSDIGLREVHSSPIQVVLVGVGLFISIFNFGFLYMFKSKLTITLWSMLAILGVIGSLMVGIGYLPDMSNYLSTLAIILMLGFASQFLFYVWKLIPHRN